MVDIQVFPTTESRRIMVWIEEMISAGCSFDLDAVVDSYVEALEYRVG